MTVFAFLKVVIEHLKTKFPSVQKIHYFTDGCAGQYKNKNNFINLSHHKEDFRLAAEWNFFATSHGKSACDGIGGTVKRLVTKASLQCPYNDQILTSEAKVDFCTKNIPGIKIFNVSPEDVTKSASELKDRFDIAQTVKGTLQFHRFVPVSKSLLHVYKLSGQASPLELVPISKSNDVEPVPEPPQQLDKMEKNFVCCMYDGFPWIGMVEKISEEFGDFHINFMHPHGPTKQFKWPLEPDHCWVTEANILCKVDTPSLTSSSSRKYYSRPTSQKVMYM